MRGKYRCFRALHVVIPAFAGMTRKKLLDVHHFQANGQSTFDKQRRSPRVRTQQWLGRHTARHRCAQEERWMLHARQDLGDAWQWADWPQYDEKFSALAFRIVSNYVVYSMTH